MGRRGGKWVLGLGLGDLLRTQQYALELPGAAHPRLLNLAQNTGAFLVLFAGTDNDLRSLHRWHGANTNHIMSKSEWRQAAEHPASAIWQALERGQMVAESRKAHPDVNCIAHPFELPSGHIAVLGMAQPDNISMEKYKRSLERVASMILSEVRRSEDSRKL